jgi:putative transposase
MPVSRFCALTGIPRRSYHRWQARARHGQPVKGPWPAPVVDPAEALVAKYAADWPAWGHRKIYGLMRADGHRLSVSSVERAMRRRGLLQPIDYQGERRELATARKAAFAEPPTGPNQVWQLDFSEYETTSGGIWRLAGVCDYYSKYEYGWHIAPGCTGADAIAAVSLAIVEAETLAGGVPLPTSCRVTQTPAIPGASNWSPTTAARSKARRSPRSSPPGRSCCTSAPAARAPARTACASGRSGH